MCSDCQPTDTTIDVRTIAPRLRHQLIFSTFESLDGGESFLVVNDHDPKPLYYQFTSEYPGIFEWVYEESGPDVWQVRIARVVAGERAARAAGAVEAGREKYDQQPDLMRRRAAGWHRVVEIIGVFRAIGLAERREPRTELAVGRGR